MPLFSIYSLALEQDQEQSVGLQQANTTLHNQTFIQPLMQRKQEHEKKRKDIKELWIRAKRKLAVEAEATYRTCIADATTQQLELEHTKVTVLRQLQDVIKQSDQMLRSATISYYQLMHMQTVALPVHYQTLCESSKLYDPGQQYAAHVRDLQLPEQPVVHYSFETYSPSSSRYKLCLELTPLTKNLGDINGMDPDVVVSTRPFRNIGLSKAAQTHKLRKLRTPAKCRECDSYVYFQGAECEEVSSSP
ncbi:hypothetical protein GOODEAATRI_006585 [Goodea atripinnis]|uniref:F-BAR domain-containing protein n=1 Tax=Goodea atripinnis TaxID=208336 RepID=A0ABV0PBZ9_9TELE